MAGIKQYTQAEFGKRLYDKICSALNVSADYLLFGEERR